MDKLRSILFGRLVGKDAYGNNYYESKAAGSSGRKKRWVIYPDAKAKDPTTVPALWHMWLHYSDDEIPVDSGVSHIPNMSGTSRAYLPQDFVLNHSDKMFYEPWSPDNK